VHEHQLVSLGTLLQVLCVLSDDVQPLIVAHRRVFYNLIKDL
jgi:hypothetical protein